METAKDITKSSTMLNTYLFGPTETTNPTVTLPQQPQQKQISI